MEEKLAEGTYRHTRRIGWEDFVEAVVKPKNKGHGEKIRQVLEDFGRMFDKPHPRDVRKWMVRKYDEYLAAPKPEGRGNKPDTRCSKRACLRLAFGQAVDDEFASVNAAAKWRMPAKRKRKKRILKPEEETKLLASTEKLYGTRLALYVRFSLATWGRFSEVTGLLWDDVDFDDRSVYFRSTKSREERFVPIEDDALLTDLHKLKAKTLRDGGPFTVFVDKSNLDKKWQRVLADGRIAHLTRHDLRRTGITRALLANVPPVTVQKLAGHRSIKTTMDYYLEVEKEDLREGMRRASAG
ncbi:MAG: site-specific integrase [Phycisphaerae bacterium]